MVCVQNDCTDPFFNLAAEEYLFERFQEPVFMLWQNRPSVIIGKYQDIRREVNIAYVAAQALPVARRFSGGGAVYHDEGNINITFIENHSSVRFTPFTKRIVRFLHTLQIPATADTRNNIFVDGLKVSGSAQHVRKNRILYHATLLFSADLSRLHTALDVPTDQLTIPSTRRKFVSSVKSPVTNLSLYLPPDFTLAAFRSAILQYLRRCTSEFSFYTFSSFDRRAIKCLRNEKYTNPQWINGVSPL